MEDQWFSLADDPNQDEALPAFLEACREKGGIIAVRAALEELTILDGSWLPQIYLARIFLEERNFQQAQDLYRAVLQRPDSLNYALFTISADLGKFGFAKEMPALIADLYNVEKHNIYIGLNLLQAYRETVNPIAGQALLEAIRRYDRPEIHDYLDDFAKAFAFMLKKQTSAMDENRVKDLDTVTGSRQEPVKEAVPSIKLPRAVWVDVPVWRHEYPKVDELLPQTSDKKRVGVYMYADTSAYNSSPSSSDSEETAAPSDLSVSLPVFIGERLLFTTRFAPIVLFPVKRKNGPYSASLEPDIQSLFALCAQESLDYIVTGTIAKDGDVYRIRTWILDKSKQSARIVAKDLPVEKYGASFIEMIDEIMLLFFDKRYAHPGVRNELFSYTSPLPELVQTQLQGLRALLYRYLVRQNECDADILPDEKFVLDTYMYLCESDSKNQMYFMSLFTAMKNGKHSGSKIYLTYRAGLYKIADQMRYAPCVKALVPELNGLLADE